MKLAIIKKGIKHVLKTCPACGDEWYAKTKQNRCTLCGTGLITRTKENISKNWDELNPKCSRQAIRVFNKLAREIKQ